MFLGGFSIFLNMLLLLVPLKLKLNKITNLVYSLNYISINFSNTFYLIYFEMYTINIKSKISENILRVF